MSRTLNGSLNVQTSHTAEDWWLLLIECMQQHGFLYSAPSHKKGESWFFSTYFPANDSVQDCEADRYWGSFSSLLRKAIELERITKKGEASSIIAAFWAEDDEGFYLEPQLSLDRSGQFLLHLNVDGAHFMAIPLEQLQRRVRRILACFQALWEMSQPSYGDMYWNSGYLHVSCAIFSVAPHLSDSTRETYSGKILNYVKRTGKHGATFFVADPFPVAHAEGDYWRFIPLGNKNE